MEIKKFDNATDLDRFLEENKDNIVALKWSGNWCGPCRLLSKTLEGLDEKKTNGVVFAEIDVDGEGIDNFVDAYSIRNIPTITFIKNHEPVERIVGLQPAEKIYDVINNLTNVAD